MDFSMLTKYIPVADTLMLLMGDAQKKWLHENVQYMPEYLRTKDGSDALLLMLTEFYEFVGKKPKL